jgi:peptidyl-prolyl cis-trans isomerase D
MLTALRSKASSWVVKALLFLLVLSFAVWGVGDFLREAGDDERAVAEVGNDEIMTSQLRKELSDIISRIQRQSGMTIDSEQIKQFGLDQMALNQLVEDRVYSSYGDKLGVRISPEMIRQRLQSSPEFLNQQGQFDPQRFETALRSMDISESNFAEQYRISTIKSFIIGSISTGVAMPKAMAESIYASRGEERLAKTILIADATITEQFTPDEETLKKYHEANAANYQAPEYRAVTLVRLDPETLVASITVSDEEISLNYEADKPKYMLPETRDIETVSYPDEAAAKAAFDLLKSGRSLADVAQTGAKTVKSETAATQDSLSQTLGKDLGKAAFAAAEGVATDPVKTPDGWVIARVAKITPARQQTLDEVKAIIKHELALSQAQVQIHDLGNQFEDLRGAGQKIEDAATELKLPVTIIAATDIAGQDEAGATISGVAGDQNLLQIIQATAEGQETRLEEAGNGGFFALRVDKVIPAATRPLDKVREAVTADWQASKRREAAAAKAQDLAQRIQAGETLDKVASEAGVTVKSSEPFSRRESEPTADLSSALISKIFELKVGDVATGRSGGDDGEVLLIVSEIRPVDLSKRDVEIQDLRDEMKQQLANDIATQLSNALRTEVGVSIDQAAIDALF